MTHEEYLLIIANEECAEIQQAISKSLRFGMNNYHPNQPNTTNGYSILEEFTQLRAAIDMLIIERIIPAIPKEDINEIYRNKIDAVKKYERISKNIGIVEDIK